MKNYTKIFCFSALDAKTIIAAKPLLIGFNKVEELIRVYDETRYLVLFGPEKYDAIHNKTK